MIFASALPGSVVLWGVTVAVGMVVGLVGWNLRRAIKENDNTHAAMTEERARRDAAVDGRIEKLIGAVEAEREARHQFLSQLGDRVWAVQSDLKENYPTRRETMRQFGTLCQKLDRHHADLSGKIEALPCRTPACPGGGNPSGS